MPLYATIDDQVSLGKSREYRDGQTSFVDLLSVGTRKTPGEVVIRTSSIVDRYRGILMEHMELVTLTDLEMVTYRQNPRLYCDDIAGNVDFWSMLLNLNNMSTSADFTKRKFWSFQKSFFDEFKKILAHEEDRLRKNFLTEVHNKLY